MSVPDRYMLEVTMLGPSGAGKTSLLASMYVQYSSVIGATDLDLTPVGDTAIRLTDVVATLKSLSRSVQVRDAVANTAALDLHRYEIAVGRKDKNPRFVLRFTDYAGDFCETSTAILSPRASEPLSLKARSSSWRSTPPRW